MLTPPDHAQTLQRVRVAMTGLLAVFVLIVVATVIYRMTNSERPVAAIGSARPETVANMTDSPMGNDVMPEPLTELGVLPSTPDNAAATR
ncbi:hypothetical protein [Sphingomonas sp. RS2018]